MKYTVGVVPLCILCGLLLCDSSLMYKVFYAYLHIVTPLLMTDNASELPKVMFYLH